MKAVISSTYDDKYLYFLPIVTYCWNRLGVDVICFLPKLKNGAFGFMHDIKESLMYKYTKNMKLDCFYFDAPEHKEATYAQCLRNYAACLDLDDSEILITSDVDMALFKIPERLDNGIWFSIFGSDLVPNGQYPQCYISAPVKSWRSAFNLYNKTYQEAIDELLGKDECEDYRGCRWSVDQEQSFLKISPMNPNLLPRSNGQNQFAQNRVDRDDTNWRAYVNDDLIDAHLWRPGYSDENFANILELLRMKFPNDDFKWLIDYTNAYKQLL